MQKYVIFYKKTSKKQCNNTKNKISTNSRTFYLKCIFK